MRVNPFKSVLLTAATCGALAGGLLAEDFTWTGVEAALGYPAFNIDCNGHPGPTCVWPDRYPDGTDDTATFPADPDVLAWEVDLITETIGDLTIAENVDFGAAVANPTLDVQRLVIVGHSDADTSITIGEAAKITITNP